MCLCSAGVMFCPENRGFLFAKLYLNAGFVPLIAMVRQGGFFSSIEMIPVVLVAIRLSGQTSFGIQK